MSYALSIVGFSNSGKTTFLEKLIRQMVNKNRSVLAIKHTHHSGADVTGQPGSNKDTDRLKRAGAMGAVLIGPGWEKEQGGMENVDLESIHRLAKNHAPDADFILIEGMKTGPAPKIEVFRTATGKEMACDLSQGLIAVVTDTTPDVAVPVFGLDDAEAVADFLINRMLQSN